jgi:hypothetical protein
MGPAAGTMLAESVLQELGISSLSSSAELQRFASAL